MNFDVISQNTCKSKSSFYNIRRLRHNLVKFNRKGSSQEGKKSRPKIQNAKKSSEFVNSMFPLLQNGLIQQKYNLSPQVHRL